MSANTENLGRYTVVCMVEILTALIESHPEQTTLAKVTAVSPSEISFKFKAAPRSTAAANLRGTYALGASYLKGAIVARRGRAWEALCDTGSDDRPGESEAWREWHCRTKGVCTTLTMGWMDLAISIGCRSNTQQLLDDNKAFLFGPVPGDDPQADHSESKPPWKLFGS